MLMFGAKDLRCQWTVTDPQGYDDSRSLQSGYETRSDLFKINYDNPDRRTPSEPLTNYCFGKRSMGARANES